MKLIHKLSIYLICVFVLTGCSSTMQIKQTWNKTPTSKWSDQIRATAAENYIYAQMAANTYEDTKRFVLPSHYKAKHIPNDDIDFAYSIFEKYERNTLKEVIISYRGTEGFKDWWYGNILTSQNKAGLEVYDRLREKTDKKVPIILTGHSLGGGIAVDVSLKRKGVDIYVFNTSPHFFSDGDIEENNRQSVVEYGEVNKVLRALLPEATQKYTSLNCIKHGNPISQHAQIKLAICLTEIAAIDSPEIKILWQNVNTASR